MAGAFPLCEDHALTKELLVQDIPDLFSQEPHVLSLRTVYIDVDVPLSF